MSFPGWWPSESQWAPHVLAIMLCSIRLLPISFLCPLFGGLMSPTTVRLGWVLSLACFLHWGAGVNAPDGLQFELWDVMGPSLREVLFGLSIGLIASLPFDAARMGGSFIDAFRGSSAEASLPFSGTRESATGDFLYQLLVAAATTTLLFSSVINVVLKGFIAVPLGQYVPMDLGAIFILKWLTLAVGTGLAVGAPIAAIGLMADLAVSLIARFAPQMNIQDSATPLRIGLGGVVLWLGVGLIANRLMDFVAEIEPSISQFGSVGP